MKITIIYGSPRKGTTYNAIQVVKEEIQKKDDVEFVEFFLPKDAPVFCKGCFQCFFKGAENCPDAKYIQPIVKELDSSDGIIIGSPIYVLQLSGALKSFFDHMGYCYLVHRPRFFKQKALVITTTAGAGIGNCSKYISQNLSYWGINKVYKCGQAVMATNWDEISPKNKEKFIGKLRRASAVFYDDIISGKVHSPSFMNTIMFNAGKALMNSYEDDSMDKQYWKDLGWLNNKSRYFISISRPNILKRAVGNAAYFAFRKMARK
ncbi:MAG: flavodoxin family protein [Bacillota bacterium]|nr:flavodoxin family protein [Bacillota bacterium]